MATAFLPNKLFKLSKRKNKTACEIDQYVFGKKMGIFSTLFGCWHNNIGRPFAQGKTNYRTCLQCGARKQFNPETLETHGKFYFPPVVKAESVNQI